MSAHPPSDSRGSSRTAALLLGFAGTVLAASAVEAQEPISTTAWVAAGSAAVSAVTGAATATASAAAGDYDRPRIVSLDITAPKPEIVVGETMLLIVNVSGSFGDCDGWFDGDKCGELEVYVKTDSQPNETMILSRFSKHDALFDEHPQIRIEGWEPGRETVYVRVKVKGEDNSGWFDDNTERERKEFNMDLHVEAPYELEGLIDGAKFTNDDGSSPQVEIEHGNFAMVSLQAVRKTGKNGKADTVDNFGHRYANVPIPSNSPVPLRLDASTWFHNAVHYCTQNPRLPFELKPFEAVFRIPAAEFTISRALDWVGEPALLDSKIVVCTCFPGNTFPPATAPSTGDFHSGTPIASSAGTTQRQYRIGLSDPAGQPVRNASVGFFDLANGTKVTTTTGPDGVAQGDIAVGAFVNLAVDGGAIYAGGRTALAADDLDRNFTLPYASTPNIHGVLRRPARATVALIPGDAEKRKEAAEWLKLLPVDPVPPPVWMTNDMGMVDTDGLGNFVVPSVSSKLIGDPAEARLLVIGQPETGRRMLAPGWTMIPVDVSAGPRIELGTIELPYAPPSPAPTTTLTVRSIVAADQLSGEVYTLAGLQFDVIGAGNQILQKIATGVDGSLVIAAPTGKKVWLAPASAQEWTKQGLVPPKATRLVLEHDTEIGLIEVAQLRASVGKAQIQNGVLTLTGTTSGPVREIAVRVDKGNVQSFPVATSGFEIDIDVASGTKPLHVALYQTFDARTGPPVTLTVPR